MRTLFITLSAIALLASCSSKEQKEVKPEIVFKNNAEPNDWTNIETIKENSNAHSGKFVSIINTPTPVSIGIVKQIKEISDEPIDSVTISFWAFLKSANIEAKTVFNINDRNGKSIVWLGYPLKEKIKETNRWVEVKETLQFPANTDKQSMLGIFVWNPSIEEILIDDFQITFK